VAPAQRRHRTGEVLVRHDLSHVDERRRPEVMERLADEVHAGFDLATGPLLRAALFDLGEGRNPLLLLVGHHAVVDGVSWRILLDDLDTAYHQALRGDEIHLGARTTSFREWAIRLRDHVVAGGLDHELDHWSSQVDGARLPVSGRPRRTRPPGRSRWS
jgi:hypothetical protein